MKKCFSGVQKAVYSILLLLTMQAANAQWTWSEKISNLTPEGLHSSPEVVVDDDGNVTAVWVLKSADYKSASIESARFSKGQWLPTQTVGSLSCGDDGCGDAYVPLIVDDNGTVTAIWNSQLNGIWTVLSSQNNNGVWASPKVIGYSYSNISSFRYLALRNLGNGNIIAFWVKKIGNRYYVQSSELLGDSWDPAKTVDSIVEPFDGESIIIWEGAIKAFVHHGYVDQMYIPILFYRDNAWSAEEIGRDVRDVYGMIKTASDPLSGDLTVSWVHQIRKDGFLLHERIISRNSNRAWGEAVITPSPASLSPQNSWLANDFDMISSPAGGISSIWTTNGLERGSGGGTLNFSTLFNGAWLGVQNFPQGSDFNYSLHGGIVKTRFDEQKSLYKTNGNVMAFFNLCNKSQLYCFLQSVEVNDAGTKNHITIDRSDPQQGDKTYQPIGYMVATNDNTYPVLVYVSCREVDCKIRGARYMNGAWVDRADLSTSVAKWARPSIVVDKQGNATSVWVTAQQGSDQSIIQARRGSEEREVLRSIDVSVQGIGRVKSAPFGIDCSGNCSASYPDGSKVVLTAHPETGYKFDKWTGDCSGSRPCELTMTKNFAMTASFSPTKSMKLKVVRSPLGTITSEPAGIMCGLTNKSCEASYVEGSSITLSAIAKDGYHLKKWFGCESLSGNQCKMTLSKPLTVSATFGKLPKYTIKIAKNTLGSIISSPAGLNCPDKKKTCTIKFTKGTEATLTPVPQQGRSFSGWGGVCSGSNDCTILMDGNKALSAAFQ